MVAQATVNVSLHAPMDNISYGQLLTSCCKQHIGLEASCPTHVSARLWSVVTMHGLYALRANLRVLTSIPADDRRDLKSAYILPPYGLDPARSSEHTRYMHIT